MVTARWTYQCAFHFLIVRDRCLELSQIEPLLPLPPGEASQESLMETVMETYSPISPNAPNLIKPLGYCDQEFQLSVSHENNSVLWDLSDFAKAGKLLKS
jgi:hypothetical protein